MKLHSTIARWHVWLGWLLAIPFLLWTASGLVMVARPIEEVRGEALRAEAPPVATDKLARPPVQGAIKTMRLVHVGARDQWVVESGTHFARYDAKDGSVIAPVTAAEARRLADAHYRPTSPVTATRAFAADAAPLDLRKNRPSWQVTFADGTHVYIDAESGETLALRTRQWRLFDFFWGLHIMDPQTREDTSHPLLIVSAALGFVSVVIGTIMLFTRRKRRLKARA